MQRVGVVWAKRHADGWRNRPRKDKPEGALTIEEAVARGCALMAEQEERLEQPEDRLAASPGLSLASFRDAVWAWHAHGRDVTKWRPATVRDREHMIRLHLEPAFGDRPIGAIDRDEVRKWWEGLHSGERVGGKVSERTANKLLAELRAIVNWAIEQPRYGLETNPSRGIAKHPERGGSGRPAFYTAEEIERLVAAAASDQDALAFKVAAYAGLRRGEVVSLRWGAIDFKRRSLHVDESISAGQDSRPKSGRGRTVPLARCLADALREARPERAGEDDLVFPGPVTGAKMDDSALRRRFLVARDSAELPPLRFHDLRHTFGSLAVDSGASLVQVQAWMGHTAIQTTMRYLHTKPGKEDAKLLDRAFKAAA